MIVFTLDEVITAPSGDFHNGQMECFDIKEEDSESIVEEVINKYKARKEEFKNNFRHQKNTFSCTQNERYL